MLSALSPAAELHGATLTKPQIRKGRSVHTDDQGWQGWDLLNRVACASWQPWHRTTFMPENPYATLILEAGTLQSFLGHELSCK